MTSPALTPTSLVSLTDLVLSRRVSDQTIFMSLDDERCYALQGPSGRLWELLESGSTFGASVATMVEEYEIDEATLTSDMTRLVANLVEKRLVTVSAADAPA